MEHRVTSGGMSMTNLGPIEQVREGMHVVDSTGDKIGKVEDIRMGDPEAVTDEGNELGDTGFLGDLAQAIGGDEREPDVPGPARAKLLRTGYIKVDSGFFAGADRYVAADMIASVSDDTVRLRMPKDRLIKED